MKTKINTSKTITYVEIYNDGLYERNGSQGKRYFIFDKAVNACGSSWFIRVPFLTVMINIFIK